MSRSMRFTLSSVMIIATISLTWVTMVFAQEKTPQNETIPQNATSETPAEKAPTKVGALPRIDGQGGGPLSVQLPNGQRAYVYTQSTPDAVPQPPIMPYGYPPVSASTPLSPEDAQFELKSRHLVGKLKETTNDAERKTLIDELTVLVTDHFNHRQKHRDQELKQLEDQLKKLREIQDKRNAARSEIIAERVSQLTRESQGLNWGAAAVDQNPGGYGGYRSVPVNAWGDRVAVAAETTRTTTGKPPAPVRHLPDDVQVFKIPGVPSDASDILAAVEALIGTGPQRPHVTLTILGNKIVARGDTDGLKLVEQMIHKLQEETQESKRDLSRDNIKK